MNIRTVHVSHSYSCDLATKELGEDWRAIEAIDQAYARLEQMLDALRAKASSGETKARAHEFFQTLSDARHDASWAGLSGEAKDAYSLANVKPTLTLVT